MLVIQLQVHISDIPLQNCISGPYYCYDLIVKNTNFEINQKIELLSTGKDSVLTCN